MNEVLHDIQTKLNIQFGWRKFRFGLPFEKLTIDTTYDNMDPKLRDNWVWRYLIATIIVGGSNEFKMQRICSTLFKTYPTPVDLANAPLSNLYKLFGKYNLEQGGLKAQRIVEISAAVVANKNKVWRSKEALMELRGVGEHTAEIIMATCYGEKHFAVDIHVKVIAGRWGLTANKLRKLEQVDGQFSRNFVDFGQQICGREPNCKECPIASECGQLQSMYDVPAKRQPHRIAQGF